MPLTRESTRWLSGIEALQSPQLISPGSQAMRDAIFQAILPDPPDELDTARLALIEVLVRCSELEITEGRFEPWEEIIILHAMLDSIWQWTFPPRPPPSRNGKSTGRPRKERNTHCTLGHEFTEENTYHRSDGGRQCRTCKSRLEKRTQ